MDERFEFEFGDKGMDLGDLFEGELAGKHDADGAEVAVHGGSLTVEGIRLRGNMDGKIGGDPLAETQRA